VKTLGRKGNSPHQIRTFGDPVLNARCPEVTDIDEALVKLAKDMMQTMEAAGGVGLAANQVGVQKRFFVYDDGHGPETIVNPVIVESDGEWTYDEGCLSVPNMYFSITRPDRVVLKGVDLDGKDIEYEAQQFQGRIFQHELDHLDGKLLLSRLDDQQRKQAMRTLRERAY
jgi:peptide deformylase